MGGPACTCEDDPTDAALNVELQQGLGIWYWQGLQLLVGAVHCHKQVRHSLVVDHVPDVELASNFLQQQDADTFMLMQGSPVSAAASAGSHLTHAAGWDLSQLLAPQKA